VTEIIRKQIDATIPVASDDRCAWCAAAAEAIADVIAEHAKEDLLETLRGLRILFGVAANRALSRSRRRP
jgi:hypothetical protein